MKRIISGVIAIPLVLGIVLYSSPLLFFGFVATVVLVASYEYFSMISNMGIEGFPVEGGVLCFLLLLGFHLGSQSLILFVVLIPVILFATWFFRESDVKMALDPIAYTFLGVFYTAGLGGYFLLIHNLEGGKQMFFSSWLFFGWGLLQVIMWVESLEKKSSYLRSVRIRRWRGLSGMWWEHFWLHLSPSYGFLRDFC